MKVIKSKYLFLQNILKFSFVFLFLSMVFLPHIVVATNINGSTNTGHPTNTGTPTNTGQNTNSDAPSTNIDVKIKNPLGNISTIPQFMEKILNIVITIGVPLVALAIIYTGFLFVTAQGKPEKLKEAKQSLVYTLIGAALLLGAWVLANAIVGTVDQIRSEAN